MKPDQERLSEQARDEWDYPGCHTMEDGETFPALCQNPACREIDSLARQLTEAERENGRLRSFAEWAVSLEGDYDARRRTNLQTIVYRAREALNPGGS